MCPTTPSTTRGLSCFRLFVAICHSAGQQGQSNKLFRDLGNGEIKSALPDTADSVNLVSTMLRLWLRPSQCASNCGQGLCGIPLPAYIFQLQEVANVTLLVLLLAMCTQECFEIQSAILVLVDFMPVLSSFTALRIWSQLSVVAGLSSWCSSSWWIVSKSKIKWSKMSEHEWTS